MILLPTKGRPLSLKRYITQYYAQSGTQQHVVILEKDDAKNYENIGLPEGWLVREYEGGKGAASHHQAVFEEFPDRPYYAFVADDTVPRTPIYDLALAEACMLYGYAWPDDGERGEDFAGHAFIRGEIVKAAGGLNPLGLHHFGFDNFWFHLAKGLGIGKYCPHVLLEHMHPRVGKAEPDGIYKEETLASKQAGDNPDSLLWRGFRNGPQWLPFVKSVHAELTRPGEKLIGGMIPQQVKMEGGREGRMLENIKRGLPHLEIAAEGNGKALALACYGPSLSETLPDLRALAEAGADVMTVSGAYDVLRGAGITPHFHVEVDPREHKAKHYENPGDTHYLIASVCHPKVFEALQGRKVTIWHAYGGEEDVPFMQEHAPGHDMLACGSTVGLSAMSMAQALGYQELHIFGMDSSLSAGSRHAGPHHGKVQKVMSVRCGERVFETTAQMISAAREFSNAARLIQPCGITLYGDGLLQEMTKESMKIAAAA